MSRPRPTHFVCLPLVGPASASQLGASLSQFWERASTIQPALPKAALRPLGTLHFTLGVMNLPDKRRLDEAVAFLNNLDLVSLLNQIEPGQQASASTSVTEITSKRTILKSQGPTDNPSTTVHHIEENVVTEELGVTNDELVRACQGYAQDEHQIDQSKGLGHEAGNELQASNPLMISLVSLGALPSAKEARILYAEPLDTTSRLYPFAQAIQQRFIEAGFIQQDMVRDFKPGRKPQLVPRPLLLHATVANTIYAPKKWSKPAASKNGEEKRDKNVRPKKESQTFDAQPLLVEFAGRSQGPQSQAGKPSYTWAEQLPIDRLCICEMGAKPIANEPFAPFGGPILSSEYRVVAERRIQP